MKKIGLVLFGQLGLLLLLFLSGCQQANNIVGQPDIKIRSLFDEYPMAHEIAKNWDVEAELFNVQIDNDISYGEVVKNSIIYRFEAAENMDNYLRIKCFDEKCKWSLEPIAFSYLANGLSPILVDQLGIDSTQAFDIAMTRGDLVFDGEYGYIDLILTINSDTNELSWVVVNSTRNGLITKSYTYVRIDPFTGEVLEIYE